MLVCKHTHTHTHILSWNLAGIVSILCVNTSGLDLRGGLLGTAMNGMMCDSHKSVGLVQDRLSAVEEIGSHASHELGHILDMAHDGTREGLRGYLV